jgi:predicted nucleic acid-binding protein
VVPTAVVRELNDGRQVGVSLPDIAAISWISVARSANTLVLPLVTDLGPGEAEVLALGLERRGAVLILDDAVARRTARMLQLPHTGTMGLLLDAKRVGYIPSVTPALDRLQELGFRVAAGTRSVILDLAGETAGRR